MLESWTLQKSIFYSSDEKTKTISSLMSLRIETKEIKSNLFDFKTWDQYCPCGCDKYSPRITIKEKLRICYHCIKSYNELKELGIDKFAKRID
jgi:hypothetical protein